MAIKVKELKDDAIVAVQANKAYYLMMKNVLMYLYQKIPQDTAEGYINDIMHKEYKDLDELQRAFHTVTLFLAEVERLAKEQNLYEEKEVLEPGDEGYVAPSQD
jgi:hypothetical protein